MTCKRPPDAASPHQGHVKTAPCFHPPNEHTGRALPDGAVHPVHSLGKLSKGTLGAPQCGEGADGCPRKSLATVLLYRGEVRRWRTSVRYADHVTTVACRWLLCPFGHLGAPPPSCRHDLQKHLIPRCFALYSPSRLGPVLEYKNHTSLYSGTKTAANQGVQMAKSIAADAKMTRLIVRSPGGSAAAILRAAFDMRLTPVPAHGPVPVMPHGPRRGVAAAGTGDVSSFSLRGWSYYYHFMVPQKPK